MYFRLFQKSLLNTSYDLPLDLLRNTKERIAQNIYIHNSNRNYKKKLTTTTILIKKRIGIGYKNYKKQCPGLEFRLIPSSSAGLA